jgi:acetylornithine deacetylase/succinyl-diaminopimelate desuccinylase-like protein
VPELAQRTGAVPLLQDLIRIDTSNPPGAERPCVAHLHQILADAGVACTVLGTDDNRPNLLARFRGRGTAPALLLHAHSDVVPVTGQQWSLPPFSGALLDSHVWGRGALDMKCSIAMTVAALLGMQARGEEPAGDVLLAVVADEEAGSAAGARYLVRQHPELFRGVRYAIGEDGGASVELGGVRFHPIVVAEKRACWLRMTIRGPSGHSSRLAPPATALAKLGRVLTTLDGARLPRHQTPAADGMLATIAGALPEPLASSVTRFSRGADRDATPQGLPERSAREIDSVVRHTVNPTVVRTPDKINMLPGEITVDLDGRILPGEFAAGDFIRELNKHLGEAAELEILLEGAQVHEERIAEPQFGGLYQSIVGILRERDPQAVPLPMVSAASTDARLFSQLGIRCYGWIPLRLPAGSPIRGLLHSPDERVPVDAVEFGTQCLTELLRGFG